MRDFGSSRKQRSAHPLEGSTNPMPAIVELLFELEPHIKDWLSLAALSARRKRSRFLSLPVNLANILSYSAREAENLCAETARRQRGASIRRGLA